MRDRTLQGVRGLWHAALTVSWLFGGMVPPAQAQTQGGKPLAELSLDELAGLEVTSVSRRPEVLADAPAAIFVITGEDIRRSGTTSLAEALRLAPNLQVARIDAGQYSITARGFNNSVSNKLLVLVDGRTIYTPLFSGVFWDQQDVLLEDVQRIEVISGPGATLWGANAVNGVINIITRSSRDTDGALAVARGGNRQQGAAFRYGGTAANNGHFRVYGKFTNLEENPRPDRVTDALTWLQGGFRADWGGAGGGLTLQGDAYRVQSDERRNARGVDIGRVELSGMNLLARWSHRLNEGSELRLQAYGDHAQREERVLFQPESDLFDVELQHSVSRGAHRFVWGAGYRYQQDDVADGALVGFRPMRRALDWANLFAQNDLRLTDKIALTVGLRLDRNDYTGWEYQPDARVAWKASAEQLVWAAVSRAVRVPARFDRDVIRPGGGVFGGPNFVSEVANVVQVGYRGRTAGVLSWSVTGFLHDWDNLRSSTAPPVFFENKIEGPVYGVEAWASWQLLRAWRISGGLTTLEKDLRLEADSTDLLGPQNPQLSNDPDQQWMVRSSLNPWTNHEIDMTVRRVGQLPNPIVPAYTAADARYAWRLHPDVELSVVGQNLFDRFHGEFNPAATRREFERGLYLSARWSR